MGVYEGTIFAVLWERGGGGFSEMIVMAGVIDGMGFVFVECFTYLF